MAKADLTAQRLRELLDYHPETGLFVWLARPLSSFRDLRSYAVWNKRYCGKVAGSVHITLGYVQLLTYFAHRLAWLHVHGVWPSGEIDHINGVKADNRIENLRDVTRSINAQNIRRPPTQKGSDLPLGVTFLARKIERPYVASIGGGGNKKHLGYFDTPELAHAAYVDAKRRLHPGCTL